MRALRSRLALVLLLCFVRVLLPDAWVLALHQHEHTTEEPTQAVGWPKGKALVSAKHQHCEADQFFKSAFEPTTTLPLGVLAAAVFAQPAPHSLPLAWHCLPRLTADLRGPPSLG
ncbi:hypothetical protein [Hymenobacter metallilatus]|uniref:Uncharacterized protein n=1 Tax=Hymenobacter metallilatus TaxID=2493666 RepID=A0A3R9MU78_9BACT|nr:hypothetical protein [Hymenobacter metallilatus]RSK30225.1 hypothetical protein EI290_15360 [Hymenobacter metallilatus]